MLICRLSDLGWQLFDRAVIQHSKSVVVIVIPLHSDTIVKSWSWKESSGSLTYVELLFRMISVS